MKLNKITDEFTYFTKANANLPGNDIRCLAMDSSGNLWMGTQDNGIGRFNGTMGEAFNSINSQLPRDQINTAIKVDADGNTWAGSGRFLVKINGDEWSIYEIPDIIPSAYYAINDIEFDKDGNGWIGTSWGLIKYSKGIFYQQYDSIGAIVEAIEIDSNGYPWLATSTSGLYRYNGFEWINYNTINSNLPSNETYDLKFDKDGSAWIATVNGLAKFNDTDWKVFNTENNSLPSNIILSLGMDEGILWIGYLENYLSNFDIFSETLIKNYELSATGIRHNRVETIAEDNHSYKWISSYSSLAKFDGKNWIVYDKSNFDLLELLFTRIYEDSVNIVWKGSGLIILYRDNREWIVSESDNKHQGAIVKEDKDGNIWIASDKGLQKLDGNRLFIYNTSNSSVPSNRISKIAFDNSDNLWLATSPSFGEKGMLVKFDGTNWVTMYTCEQVHYWIAGLEIDSSDNLWIGILSRDAVGVEFGSGIKKYDGINWISYDIYNSELPSNSVMQLCLDKDQNLWAGMWGGGAVKFNRKDEWIVYNKFNSGLPGNEVERIAVDRNNNKWFGVQQSGLAVFNEEGVILSAQENIIHNVLNSFELYQNYPNPFNPTTTIKYSIPQESFITLKIYDILGKEIASLVKERKIAGNYSINFNAGNFPSGIYFYQLKTHDVVLTKKMVLLR